jgi:peroxin-5
MSGGDRGSAFRDLLLTPDGCAPDDDSSVAQNPIMRLTDQILFGGPSSRMGNDSVREKQMQRDRETGETLSQKQRWTADQERQRRMNNGGRQQQQPQQQQQRQRSDVMARQVAPAMEREYERQLVQQQQQQNMDHAWRREQEMMAEQRQRDAMMMRERSDVGLMTPAPIMEMQMRQQQRQQDWGGEFARERERERQQRRMMENSGGEWANEFAQRQQNGQMVNGGNNRWANEFEQMRGMEHARWANEFTQQRNGYNPPQQWANQFSQQRRVQQQQQQQQQQQYRGETRVDAETRMHSAELARTLAQDPKFANSSFVKLMQNIGSGQVAVRDNDLRSVDGDRQLNVESEDWAKEFQSANISGGERWANEFQSTLRQQQAKHQTNSAHAAENWANEFSSLPEQWANEFTQTHPQYANQFDSAWNESAQVMNNERNSEYVFTNPNPYDGNVNALQIGKDLIKTGVLSEATLALEAAVKQPESQQRSITEAWRLLGEAHAENDDDVRAIAAMREAHRLDPLDAEVALQLAVSHTNELEKTEAIQHAISWLRQQQGVSHLVDGKNIVDENEARDAFREASRLQPQNANIHAVVGVLAHLTRDYDEAVRAFETAARLNPQDHRLHNKIGATKANAAKSSEAISSYRSALDLKPNYTRAWTNMGIGFANQGRYEASVAYYLRALELNPNAENAWGYLRISLGCTGRIDLMPLVDEKNVRALAREFPVGTA